MKVKGFAWAGVGTDNFDRTLSFFTDVLGLPMESSGDKIAHLKVGPRQTLEILGEGSGRVLNATPTIAFEVEDFDTARDELSAAGIELVGEVGRWKWL